MKRVTGIGGIFFKSKDPGSLKSWYETHLGIAPGPAGTPVFEWTESDTGRPGCTVWSPFGDSSDYFEPTTEPSFMVNYRVHDLDALLVRLREEGVEIDDDKGVESHSYGKFAWITDPEGRRLELWEPAAPPTAPDESGD
ncbi:MAG: glyoxalase [Planctomycetes bacterium]|nr:glyoxalase [Planctomycetota bacterium]